MNFQRKHRSLVQLFYLLKISRKDKKWTIEIKGLTSNYTVTISSDILECSCPDYQQKGNFCKHLYFIILKVAGCYQIILDHNIFNDKKLNIESFNKLDNCLVQKVIQYIDKDKDKNKSKTDQDDSDELSKKKRKIMHDCLICLDEIINEEDDQECELQCHTHFHKSCLSKWLKINKTCPHCRSISSFALFSENLNNVHNLWEKIQRIDIDILVKS